MIAVSINVAVAFFNLYTFREILICVSRKATPLRYEHAIFPRTFPPNIIILGRKLPFLLESISAFFTTPSSPPRTTLPNFTEICFFFFQIPIDRTRACRPAADLSSQVLTVLLCRRYCRIASCPTSQARYRYGRFGVSNLGGAKDGADSGPYFRYLGRPPR